MSLRETIRVLIAVINLSGKCLERECFLPQNSVTAMKNGNKYTMDKGDAALRRENGFVNGGAERKVK